MKDRSSRPIVLAVALVAAVAGSAWAQASGEAIYRERCAGCHDQTSQRIPPKTALQKMPATRILRVLDFGVMMSVAYPLKRDEREAVAKYLGADAPDSAPLAQAFCADRTARFKVDNFGGAPLPVWNGWSPSSS